MPPSSEQPGRLATRLIYTAIVAICAFTLFYNLGDRLFWSDEAESALLAVNVTKFGVPKTVDGRNLITILGGKIDGNARQIWTWSPWADEYLAAASFLLFDVDTVAARLPFAAAGLISLVLLGRLAYRLFASHEAAIIAMLLYATNIAFLLHARQCRYYSLLMLAQIVLVSGYERMAARRRFLGAAFVIPALTIQFYSNYMAISGNVLALIVAALVGGRKQRGLISFTAACLILTAGLAAPWVLYAQSAGRQSQDLAWRTWPTELLFYVNELHLHVLSLVVLLIPAVVRLFHLALAKSPKTTPPAPEPADLSPAAQNVLQLCWLMLPCHLAVISLLPMPFFRYITPLIPVLMLIAAGILVRYVRAVWLRYALLVVLCLSNGLSLVALSPLGHVRRFESPYIQFVRGICTPYTDRTEDVVAYIQQHAGPDDTILIMDPEFALIFYTGRKIIDARLTQNLTAPPDWVLSESASGTDTYDPLGPPESIAQLYEEIAIPVHKTRRGASRPDPHFHEDFTAPEMTVLKAYRLRESARANRNQQDTAQP